MVEADGDEMDSDEADRDEADFDEVGRDEVAFGDAVRDKAVNDDAVRDEAFDEAWSDVGRGCETRCSAWICDETRCVDEICDEARCGDENDEVVASRGASGHGTAVGISIVVRGTSGCESEGASFGDLTGTDGRELIAPRSRSA